MRINCHTHVFNAKSVFNKYTIEILLKRLSGTDIPEPLKTAVDKQLKQVIAETGDYVDEKKFFQNVLTQLSDTKAYKGLLKDIKPSLKIEFDIIGSDKIKEASADALAKLISKICEAFESADKDVRRKDVLDFLDFLRIALQPSVRNVTDIIVNQLPNQSDGLIALMMDITQDGKDNGQFERQLKDTSDMVLAYPGRLFPFIAVNPNRPNHLQLMERALNGMGFTGVKLYPSLGYEIDSPAMYAIYAYCEERQIPVLMHCSKGGFKYDDQYTDYSSPMHWKKILENFRNLKICFGHFGGDECHAGLPEIDGKPPWGGMILQLMEQYPNVYADIAYHTAPMDGGKTEDIYFRNLKSYLGPEKYADRILWGSDYFLVRQRLREKNHWNYIQAMLGRDLFTRIADINPTRYLGLDPKERSWAIDNYVQFVSRNSQHVETMPAPWLIKAVRDAHGDSVVFQASPLGRAWSRNNKVHYTLYEDFNHMEFLEPTPFESSGSIKLSAMAYWRDLRLGSSQMAKMNLRRRAVQLISVFDQKGAIPALIDGKRIKKEQMIQKMCAVLKDGSKTVADLGALCDSLFDFETA
ncbi:MAG: amidohydrolase [Proteobacteria bacterium]|nr:amidohydrolase [Pseudomonadota bacterium]